MTDEERDNAIAEMTAAGLDVRIDNVPVADHRGILIEAAWNHERGTFYRWHDLRGGGRVTGRKHDTVQGAIDGGAEYLAPEP